jgi:hypothetical protein
VIATLAALAIAVAGHVVVVVYQVRRSLDDCRAHAGGHLRDVAVRVRPKVRQCARQVLVGDTVFAATSHVIVAMGVGAPTALAWNGARTGLSTLKLCTSATGSGEWLHVGVPGLAIGSVTSTTLLLFKAYHQPITPENVPLPKRWAELAARQGESDPLTHRFPLLEEIRRLVGLSEVPDDEARSREVTAIARTALGLSAEELLNRIRIILTDVYDRGQALRRTDEPNALETDLARIEEILHRVTAATDPDDRLYYYEAAINRLWESGGAAAASKLNPRRSVIDLADAERQPSQPPSEATMLNRPGVRLRGRRGR